MLLAFLNQPFVWYLIYFTLNVTKKETSYKNDEHMEVWSTTSE